MSQPISFLSDFGLNDEFVGVVHGVIATLAPESRIIDITHGVARGDVRAGSLALMRSIQYLPDGVAVAVVDPGVGTARRAVAVETEWGVFVGPDNGLLSPAVATVGGASSAVSIENPEVRLPMTGATFHGRDIFAPAAALLASGQAGLHDLGPAVDVDDLLPMLLPLAEPEPGAVRGSTWWIDRFGNVQTNISPDDLGRLGLAPGTPVSLDLGANRHDVPWVTTYGEASDGTLVLLVDSHGLIAISVVGGSAASKLGLVESQPLTMRPVGEQALELRGRS